MRLYLPPRPTATILCGALDLDEGHVAPGEPVQRGGHAKAGAGAATVGVDPQQLPLLEEVVHELRVIRDVGEVLEDLVARAGDR